MAFNLKKRDKRTYYYRGDRPVLSTLVTDERELPVLTPEGAQVLAADPVQQVEVGLHQRVLEQRGRDVREQALDEVRRRHTVLE